MSARRRDHISAVAATSTPRRAGSRPSCGSVAGMTEICMPASRAGTDHGPAGQGSVSVDEVAHGCAAAVVGVDVDHDQAAHCAGAYRDVALGQRAHHHAIISGSALADFSPPAIRGCFPGDPQSAADTNSRRW